MKPLSIKLLFVLPLAVVACIAAYQSFGPVGTELVHEVLPQELPKPQNDSVVKNTGYKVAGLAGSNGGSEAIKQSAETDHAVSTWDSVSADPKTMAEWREKAEAKRALRIHSREQRVRNPEQMAERASRSLARRLRLTDDQRNQVSQIYQQYAKQLSALDNFDGTSSELAQARRRIEGERIQELMPIWSASPALQTARAQFMEAGRLAGATLITPAQERKLESQ